MTITTVDVGDRIEELSRQVDILVVDAMERKRVRDSLSELTKDLSPIARQTMESATSVLTRADERGYLDFARSSLGVADRIVTEFSSEDVEALGDNIVLILETIREMTQPEVMGMMRSTLHRVQETEPPTEPPSAFSLLRRLREPDVRRGLSLLITLLESLGSSEADNPMTKEALS